MKKLFKKLKVYTKIDKKYINLLQKADLDKKVENYKLKKLSKKYKTMYKNG